jgi:hypothetical protein
MTDEIMPREDRSGKVWAFLGGCIAGIAGLFAVAVFSEMSSSTTSFDDLRNGGVEQDESLVSR